MQLTAMINVRHFAFIESLAAIAVENSPEWQSYTTVFAMLRLIDLTGLGVPLTENALAVARDSVERMPVSESLAPLVARTLDALEEQDATKLAGTLRDIGRSYLSRASWTHALDVYESAVDAARKADAADILLDSMHGMGHAIRMLRRFDEAAAHYATLRRTALRLGSVRYRLEARLGMAKLAINRGNFPLAETLLDRVIAQSRTEKCKVVLSKALQDRAYVAGEANDHVLSLQLAKRALDNCDDPRERDRILINVARALAMVGERQAARDANLVIEQTAQDRDMRWLAAINLMEIAYLDGHAEAFDRYRTSLAEEPLPPALEAWYYEFVGAGCARFRRGEESRVAYERMLAVAVEHDLAESTIKAELALAGHPSAPAKPSARRIRRISVHRIATAVTNLRIAAGVSA